MPRGADAKSRTRILGEWDDYGMPTGLTSAGTPMPLYVSATGVLGVDLLSEAISVAIENVHLKTIAGATPQMDDTDKLAVSVYGALAGSPAGRIPILTNASGVPYFWLASAIDALTDDITVYSALEGSPAGRVPLLATATGHQFVWLGHKLDSANDAVNVQMIASVTPTMIVGSLAVGVQTIGGVTPTLTGGALDVNAALGAAQITTIAGVTPSMTMSGLHVVLQDPNDSTRQAELDTTFKAPITINIGHHEIHEGRAFVSSAVDTSMGTAATFALAFKTMASPMRAHMWVKFLTLTGGHVEIIEGPGWTNQSGTLNPIYNRKREATATMGTSSLLEDQGQASFVASGNVILSPTAVSGGIAITTEYAFGAKNQFSGGARGTHEVVLKPETQYAVKFTSDAASNKVDLELDWYEHTDG